MKLMQIELSDRFEVLRPVLETWCDRIKTITAFFPQSGQRYFLEPTLVGLLAGAAWSHDMQAITEVKCKRISNKRGRLDLLIRSSAGSIAMEAKIVWDHEFAPKAVEELLKTACSEVASIVDCDADIKLGGVFFVPWGNNNYQASQLEDNVLKPLTQIKVDVKALSYDRTAEYPGVALLARQEY